MNLLFIGPVGNLSDGYGNAASGIYKILDKMFNCEGETCTDGELFLVDTSKAGFKVNEEIFQLKYDIVILVANPFTLLYDQNMSNLYTSLLQLGTRRYLSIVWETDPFPAIWNSLWHSDLFTGFLCPSMFILNMLKRYTTKQLFYYPHHIDIDQFPLININAKIQENTFKVLFTGQYTARKGFQDAIISYCRTFMGYEDVELIMKISYLTNLCIEPNLYMRSIALDNTTAQGIRPKISFIDNNLNIFELINLYHSSSVLLFPTRGEGFGLPLGEAMSCGLPIIYTDWSACPEVAKSPNNYKIDYTLDDAYSMANFGYETGLKYAVPKISCLIDALSSAYSKWKNNKEKYYLDSMQNREIINERFGEEKIKGYLLDIINNKCYVEIKNEKEIEEKKYVDNEVGKVIKDDLGFKWYIRHDSLFNNVYQDNVGSDLKHEQEVLNACYKYLIKDTIFIDVGAHVGYYSIRLANKVKKVLSIEPDNGNVSVLTTNMNMNNIFNYEIIPYALGEANGIYNLFQKGAESTLFKSDSIKGEQKVNLITFDSIVNKLDLKYDPIFIKIDTEGYELQVLNGMQDFLKREDITILIEYHEGIYDYCQGQRQQIIDNLNALGYKIVENYPNFNKFFFKK